MRQRFTAFKLSRRVAVVAVVFVFLGFVLSTAVRFALVQDSSVHYHANFALYIDGQRQEFKSFTFYEEIAACSAHGTEDPKHDAHMHDNNPGLVHVHSAGVTWGEFFNNIGYNLGRQSIETDTKTYVDGDADRRLTFVLNGQVVNSPTNQLINSEDRLLINYGTEQQSVITERFATVPSDAHQANVTADPAACAGAHSLSWQDRLKQAIGMSHHNEQ